MSKLVLCLAQFTFRRVLLNKCQEEFEEGDAAIKAVDAREKAAAAAEAQNVHALLRLCCSWRTSKCVWDLLCASRVLKSAGCQRCSKWVCLHGGEAAGGGRRA